MAPLLFRDMKGLSCSSPASTAICPSLERQPMVRSHKAIASPSPSPSPLAHVPSEPRTHRHDGKKGQQQQQHKAVVVPNNIGGLVSPAGSSRYLLSSGRFAATVTEEIQEVVESAPAPAVDAKREEASEAADAKSGAQVPEQVRNPPLTCGLVDHY